MTTQSPLGILNPSIGKEVLYAMSDGFKILLGFLAGVIVVLLFGSVLGGGGMMGGMGSMMGGGLFGMLFALLFWVLVTALIIALVVWILNLTQHR